MHYLRMYGEDYIYQGRLDFIRVSNDIFEKSWSSIKSTAMFDITSEKS